MRTRPRKLIHIRKASHGLRCVDLESFESKTARSRKRKRCFPNSRRSMEKKGTGVGRRCQIRLESLLDIDMSNDVR